MSDFGVSKRARGGGSGGDKDGPGGGVERSSSSSSASDVLSQDLKISILEQRLHEIQALKFDSIFGDRKEITAPTKLYVDPLLNLEIGVLRQREEILTRKLNSAGIGLDDDINNSNSNSNSSSSSELENIKEENLVLKRKLASLSSENQIKQIEFKDNLIRELVNKVNDAKSWIKELEQENVYLSSQLLLYQQHIATLTTSASEMTDVASVVIAQAESK